jgi:large subunit ribosomal protein L6
MSRIGKVPVEILSGVTVELKDGVLTVKGPKGTLTQDIHSQITVEITEKEITVTRSSESKEARSLQGLMRSLIHNMVVGVKEGYEKKLEIVGVGYRAKPNKNKISLSLGFSHPIEVVAPDTIEFKMDAENKNIIIVSGIDKQLVGEMAAKIRSYKKPEPYKGKGIKYIDEHVPRKAGKAAASAS